MQTKLTLRMDDALIRKAKRYSKRTGKSVSKLVADYLALIDTGRKMGKRDLAPRGRSRSAALSGGKVTDEDGKKHLERKHRAKKSANGDWKAQVEYYLRARDELLGRYGDRWVAIKDGAVVDEDDDRLALITRINKSYPTEVVLVVRPTAGRRVVELPSPEYQP